MNRRRNNETQPEKYNPGTSSRELNPYWKQGGDGLPTFQKPQDEDDDDKQYVRKKSSNYQKPCTTSGWRKQSHEKPSSSSSSNQQLAAEETNTDPVLSNKELNLLASKLVKAEIMGNTKLIAELKSKLEKARLNRQNIPENQTENAVMLTETNSRGETRPLAKQSQHVAPSKKRKTETHQDGERVRYFVDDDRYSLAQMFQTEKFSTSDTQNEEFVKMAGKIKANDDMEDVFTDKIRNNRKREDDRSVHRAINQHKQVESCKRCLESNLIAKNLIISISSTIYLTLPAHEPLTPNSCKIIPIRHVDATTLLDENEWAEVLNVQKALIRMFDAEGQDVIFFEMAKNAKHMSIECIPVDREAAEMAPMYFKKAIDECESEWTSNKKLVSLKDKDVRRAIPKGLNYFWVNFGVDFGYAHVIEDLDKFPNNFAEEIIGGMLDLHHSKWKRAKKQSFEEQSKRAVEFTEKWKEFDCTIKE